MTDATLLPAELNFIKRMAFHVEKGLSFDDAARAVIADDERLFNAFCDRSAAHYVQTFDDRGTTWTNAERPGDVIRRELSRSVYRSIRRT